MIGNENNWNQLNPTFMILLDKTDVNNAIIIDPIKLANAAPAILYFFIKITLNNNVKTAPDIVTIGIRYVLLTKKGAHTK